jgi:hypothetical protein
MEYNDKDDNEPLPKNSKEAIFNYFVSVLNNNLETIKEEVIISDRLTLTITETDSSR